MNKPKTPFIVAILNLINDFEKLVSMKINKEAIEETFNSLNFKKLNCELTEGISLHRGLFFNANLNNPARRDQQISLKNSIKNRPTFEENSLQSEDDKRESYNCSFDL